MNAPAKSSPVEDLVALFCEPGAQTVIQNVLFEYSSYGHEAIAFAENCSTKDYSILWEEYYADKAEFRRLVNEHWKKSAFGQSGREDA